MDFISDLTKEIHKDVIGQKIFYYSVREDLSEVHSVYEESTQKIFDPPVEIECRIDWEAQAFKTNKFGHEGLGTAKVYLHIRDLLDRGIKVQEGDFFSYGDTFYEVTSFMIDKKIFGQVEYSCGYIVNGKQARQGQISFKPLSPTEEKYSDPNSVQEKFVQQRGFEKNEDGLTGDSRELRKQGILDQPISGPKKVDKTPNSKSKFYGDT